MRLEQERDARFAKAIEDAKQLERQTRLKEAQDRVAKSKAEDRKLVLSVQKEERRRRVDKVMKKMKRREWLLCVLCLWLLLCFVLFELRG